MPLQSQSIASRLSDARKRDVTSRMVELMRDRIAITDAITEADLKQAGQFSDDEIALCGPAAAAIMGRLYDRDVLLSPDEAAQLSVEARLPNTPERGARIVAGLCPNIGLIHQQLRVHGWSNGEIAEQLTEILSRAGRAFANLLPKEAVQ
ncbi:MAG: hypothetical protein H6873_05470 [Hyphomicrobiaceae bacterium]|nr:hypothetical protein [Hyphomicrobiaceae bacterium]